METFHAACTLGLEEALAGEIRELGGAEVTVKRGGVTFGGDLRLGYRACLWLRSAIRVQHQLARGPVRSKEDLYKFAAEVDWSRSIRADQTLAVDCSIRESFTTDSRFPALIVKDAVVDQFRKKQGRRPDVDKDRPDLPIKVVLQRGEGILYRDLAGRTLHKRGYREIMHKSPLNEAFAAGLLLLTGWDRKQALCDPMCGSGTFLIEAALMAADRAPGLRGTFAFERWRDLWTPAWTELKAEAERRAAVGAALPQPAIIGNDRHPGAVSLAKLSLKNAGLRGVRIATGDIRDYVPQAQPQLVVTNPPYGERLDGDGDEGLAESWEALGTFLKHRCPNAVAWVLSGNPETTKHLGLRTSRKLVVHNGPIECRWLRYEMTPLREPGPAPAPPQDG
ncbi:MAG: putative rRNA (2-N-methyl-G2445)-methyltransferase [Planctomycetota bacterium]